MMTINSGSKIPRRKRVAHFSSSQSKVRVIEDVMAKGLEVKKKKCFRVCSYSVAYVIGSSRHPEDCRAN